MRRDALRCCLLVLSALGAKAQPTALSVNTASREEVRQFYRTLFPASENVPLRWNGDAATGDPGDTSTAFKEATRLRINFFRALVGVPADITFNRVYNARAQEAAFLMSVNDRLSHTPPPSWIFYHPSAAEGALNSNLALGRAGPDAIHDFMADAGAGNGSAGHRRWLLYPQTLQMGTGDVLGTADGRTRQAANAVWVIDTTPGGEFGAPRPVTRTTAVPYPPAGFVPYPLVWPRWSFSHPEADFSSATVRMTRDGRSVTVEREPVAENIGEPTLVWVYDAHNPETATPHPRPRADTTYTVSVENVRISGTSRNFGYNVTVFDPDAAGPDTVPVAISGPRFPSAGVVNSYAVSAPSFVRSFEWRMVELAAATPSFSAETGFEGLVPATSAGYAVVQSATVATGARAYRLAHVGVRADETLRLPGTYLVNGPDSNLTFRSRLGIATAAETARVQVSLDDGRSWLDVFTQSGTSPTDTHQPTPTEINFVARTLPLAPYAGRTLAVRLVFSVGFGITFVPDPDNAVGWFIDDLALNEVQVITPGAPTRIDGGTEFAFTPAAAGPIGLQSRGVMFGAYPMEWGPVTRVNAVDGGAGKATFSMHAELDLGGPKRGSEVELNRDRQVVGEH